MVNYIAINVILARVESCDNWGQVAYFGDSLDDLVGGGILVVSNFAFNIDISRCCATSLRLTYVTLTSPPNNDALRKMARACDDVTDRKFSWLTFTT